MLAITCSALLGMAALTGLPQHQARAASTAPAKMAPKEVQNMTYELYAGGINAVQATLDVAGSKDSYSMELYASTKGFLGKLVPWKGSFETHGWRLKDGSEKPELHKSIAFWAGEEDVKEYSYGKDGSFKGLKELKDGKEKPKKKFDDKLVQGTTDVLTASLKVMEHVSETGECKGEDQVFDGKRRFKLIFRHKADEVLTPSKFNLYKGVAARCEVEVVPSGGAWNKKPRGWLSIQEQGREKGSLPTVWLAKIDDKGPAVPVKMRVKTDYGTLFMHLVDYKNDGKEKAAVGVQQQEEAKAEAPTEN